MTADEFIRVASITLDEVRKAREEGADRERRRIRRAQRDAILTVSDLNVSQGDLDEAVRELDAATRAKRSKRK